MNCQYCGEGFVLKKEWIAKRCICDDEERFISLEDWYYLFFKVAFPAGFEPATIRLEGGCSIQLSYKRKVFIYSVLQLCKKWN